MTNRIGKVLKCAIKALVAFVALQLVVAILCLVPYANGEGMPIDSVLSITVPMGIVMGVGLFFRFYYKNDQEKKDPLFW